MNCIIKKLLFTLVMASVISCCSMGTKSWNHLSIQGECIDAVEKVILTTPRYREWLSDCKKQLGQQSEDGEKLVSCGFRGPKEFQQTDPKTKPELEWGFHSNWSGRISVEMWLRYNLATESVEEMLGDYEPVEFDRSLLGEIRKLCMAKSQ